MIINIDFTAPTSKQSKFPVFSWLIRLLDKTAYSHVRLRWTNSVGVEIIYEASGSSLKFLGPRAAEGKTNTLASFKTEVNRDQYRALIKLCMTYAGIDYGVKQVLGIGLVRLFNLKKNPLSDGRYSQVCSEIVGVYLEQIQGFNTGLDLDIASPKDIYNYLIKTGELNNA